MGGLLPQHHVDCWAVVKGGLFYRFQERRAVTLVANNTRTKRVGNNGNGFKPGQSGNPKGRPKQTQEQKDALAMIKALAPEAAERLREIIRNPDIKVETQLKAIEIVFDRTYGKGYATEGTTSEPVRIVIDV